MCFLLVYCLQFSNSLQIVQSKSQSSFFKNYFHGNVDFLSHVLLLLLLSRGIERCPLVDFCVVRHCGLLFLLSHSCFLLLFFLSAAFAVRARKFTLGFTLGSTQDHAVSGLLRLLLHLLSQKSRTDCASFEFTQERTRVHCTAY